MSLNLRSLQIIDYLLDTNDFTKIQVLAEKVQTSERNVRYSLKKIEEFLSANQFQALIRHQGKGVFLEKNPELISFLADFKQRTTPYLYNYSKEELRSFILLKLLIEHKPVPIAYFEDQLYVSRSTVLGHLKGIDLDLYLQGMELKSTPRSGYQINGNEISKATAFANLFIQNISIREFYNFIETETNTSKIGELYLYHLFEIESLQLAMQLLNQLESELKLTFDDRSCLILIVFLIKWLSGSKELTKSKRTNFEIKQVEFTQVKNIIERWIDQTKITEAFLVQLIELIHSLRNIRTEKTVDESLNQAIKQLCLQMSQMLKVDFLQDQSLMASLSTHINAMVQRINKGMSLENPLFTQFVEQHSEVFHLMKQACKSMEETLSLEISDHEISFLAIYFVSSLQKIEAQKRNKPKILVVCVEGVAVSKMLAISIKNLFDIDSVETISVRSLTNELAQFYDFIISTVDIPDVDHDKLIKIDRFIGAKEIELLKDHLTLNLTTLRRNDVNKLNQIMEAINETCDIRDPSKLQFALLNILIHDPDKHSVQEAPTPVAFSESSIQLHASAQDWQEAIQLGTRPLIEQNYIEQSYHDKIIENIQTIGPYMVVAPGVILSHAGPDDGVHANSFSIVTLDKGVDFGDKFNKPVQLIWTLAMKEAKSQILIEKIMSVILDQNLITQILETKSTKDVYSLIKQHIL
ncbi:BglG family transcription antiterminator [Shimazuella kribbensis]|uniref:BglG family transcription antiterminator n=1 Tax=Shimazuella kribbensis TaxID=139808 RepID=UPI00048F1E89|nr:BglG family transcription antiterminator [Shimazuella kribbensis]